MPEPAVLPPQDPATRGEPDPTELPAAPAAPDPVAPAEPAAAPEAPAEPEAPAAPSAEELAAQLAEANAKIAALEAPPAAPEPAAPAAPAPGGIQHMQASAQFVREVLPAAKQAFIKDTATPEQQFDTLYDMTNRMVGAVLQDRVAPVALANVEMHNEIEIRDLRVSEDGTPNPEFRALEPTIRKELAQMSWKDRATGTAVSQVYDRLLGAKTRKPGAAAPAPAARPATPNPAARAAVRDISTPAGAVRPKVTVTLTAEQEADRSAMEADGQPMSAELYAAKYKARADKAKALGKPIPRTYRG